MLTKKFFILEFFVRVTAAADRPDKAKLSSALWANYALMHNLG